MTRRVRSLLFWILVCCFIVTAPPILLWSRGYRLDVRTWRIVQVGGIFIRTTPLDAAVTIEGLTRKFSPSPLAEGYVMQNLLPGTYQVTVTKDGYFPWSTALTVEALRVTRKHAVLFLRAPVKERLEGAPPTPTPTPTATSTPYRLDAAGNLSYGPVNGKWLELATGVLAFSPDPELTRIALVTNNRSLAILFLKEVSNGATYRANTLLNVGVLSGRPLNIYWMKDGWHLLLRFADRLEIVDIESPANRFSYPIATTNAVFDRDSNTLTYRAKMTTWRLKFQ